MTNVEKNFLNFFHKHYIKILVAIITILAVLIRFIFLKFESDDYTIFLHNWFDYLKQNGGLNALRHYPGDYNAPYMTILALLTYLPIKDLYLIKAVSIGFDFLLALACGWLATTCVSKNKKLIFVLTYIIMLFVPQVLMNSSMWGQCDSIYATFVVLSLVYLMKEKYTKSFILLGISFAFKFQFIFILPLYLILYFSKKSFSILNFLLVPIMNFVLCLPAIIFGKPIKDCLMVYFNQAGTYKDSLVNNFPNIYNILSNSNLDYYKAGIIFTFIVCALLLFYVLLKKVKWNKEKILGLSILIIVLVTYFLPSMHDRYAYVAEILSFIYLLCYRKNFSFILILNINALLMYSKYLNYFDITFIPILSIIYGISIIYFAKNILYDLKNN